MVCIVYTSPSGRSATCSFNADGIKRVKWLTSALICLSLCRWSMRPWHRWRLWLKEDLLQMTSPEQSESTNTSLSADQMKHIGKAFTPIMYCQMSYFDFLFSVSVIACWYMDGRGFDWRSCCVACVQEPAEGGLSDVSGEFRGSAGGAGRSGDQQRHLQLATVRDADHRLCDLQRRGQSKPFNSWRVLDLLSSLYWGKRQASSRSSKPIYWTKVTKTSKTEKAAWVRMSPELSGA